MNDREHNLALGMIDNGERQIGGIKLRSFSFGSMQMAYLLNLTLFTGVEDEEGNPKHLEPNDLDPAELHRQIAAFAWMQSAHVEEISDAFKAGVADRYVLGFALGITMEMLPELMAEINRISVLVTASAVRVESKHSSDEGDAPGKS